MAPVASPASDVSALVCESLQPLQEICTTGLSECRPIARKLKMGTHNISGACPCGFGHLFRLLCVSSGSLNQAHGRFEDTTHITASVRGYSRKKSLTGFYSEVWFLDFAFR